MNNWRLLQYKTQPYNHQRQVIDKSIDILECERSVALFMEMSTGKTFCIIKLSEFLQNIAQSVSNTVIICPKSLQDTWENEITKHGSYNSKILKWDSCRVKTKKYKKELASFKNYTGVKYFIVNIEAFSRENEHLKYILKEPGYFCALDESTFIKNHKAQRTKRSIDYTKKAKYKAILTGMEIEKSILDIYAQFDFLRPGFWGKNFYKWRGTYAILQEVQLPNRRPFKIVKGFRKVDELKDIIKPYTIRIQKKDCFDLPEKIFQSIPVTMNKEQQTVYDDMKEKLFTEYKGHVLTAANKAALFTRFRQITGGFMPETGDSLGDNVKLKTILDDCEAYPGKIIIWSCFKESIKNIKKSLDKEYKTIVYYGEEKGDLNEFRDNSEVKFLIMNPQTGAYGLNLQFTSLSYWYDLPLSLGHWSQANDRQHRPGQEKSVIIKSIICKDSIDTRLVKLLQNKKEISQSFRGIGDFI